MIDIAELIAEYGNYYKAGSQNLKDLKTKLFQPSVTEAFFTPRLTDSTRLELANASITRVLQAFQSAFTPIGDTKFTPQPLILDHMKIDAKIVPHDLMESWLGFLASNALKPEQCPIVKYWIEELVIPQFQEDLELSEIFNGKKLPVVAGTASALGASMNGFRETLKRPDINIVTMGAIPTDNVELVEYVEDFAGNLPELLRAKTDAIAMRTNLAERYVQGMRVKYNMHYAQATDLMSVMDKNLKIQSLPSMIGNDVMFATPKDNRIIANKNPKNQSLFNIQVENRDVKALTDFHKGIGVWSDKFVYRTDTLV